MGGISGVLATTAVRINLEKHLSTPMIKFLIHYQRVIGWGKQALLDGQVIAPRTTTNLWQEHGASDKPRKLLDLLLFEKAIIAHVKCLLTHSPAR